LNKDLYFSKTFYSELQWKNSIFFIGAILPDYQNDLSEGMNHLSAHSIRNRFLGAKKELTDKELRYLTELDGFNHFALGIKNSQNKGIAIARMVRDHKQTNQAEIAITIIDQYQGQGFGALLYKFIALAAFERGIDTLLLHLLGDNHQMQHIIRKLGKIEKIQNDRELYTYHVKLTETDLMPVYEMARNLMKQK